MQLTYNANPGMGRAGMLADASLIKRTVTRLAAGAIKAGVGVFRLPGIGAPGTHPDPNPGTVYQNPDPAGAADVDAILATGGASAATQQVWDGAELNGVVGGEDMYPARRVTLVLSNTADWDATTAVARYVNHLGQTVTENLAIPNGGNATVTTTGYVRRFLSLTIPAQSGALGTFTIGIAAIDASITLADFDGIALYDSATLESALPSSDTEEEYQDGATVAVLRVGNVWVETEDACTEGGDVYMRVTASGANTQLGAFRSDADGGSAVAITGARFGRTSTAGGLNIVELRY